MGLSPGGSTHLHTTIHSTTQITTKGKSAGRAPSCEFYAGICLTTEGKARKNLSKGKKNPSQIKKTSVRVQ